MPGLDVPLQEFCRCVFPPLSPVVWMGIAGQSIYLRPGAPFSSLNMLRVAVDLAAPRMRCRSLRFIITLTMYGLGGSVGPGQGRRALCCRLTSGTRPDPSKT